MVNIDIRDAVDFVTAIFFMGLLSWKVGKKWGKLIGAATFYFFSSAIAIFMNPLMPYNFVFPLKIHVSVGFVSGQAFALGLLIFLFVAFSSKKLIAKSFEYLKYIAVANAVVACLIPGPYNGGLFWGNTFDVTFATLFIPFMFDQMRKGSYLNTSLFGLTVGAAIYVGSITPFLMILGACVFYFPRGKLMNIALAASGLVVALVASYYYTKHAAGHASERLVVWERVTRLFLETFNPILGTGTGTYRIVGPVMQQDQTNVFYFVHNEFLQVFIEQGIVGLGLMGALIVRAYRELKSKAIYASLSCLLLCSIVQYPLRVGVSFAFVLILFRMCIDNQKGRTHVVA